MKIVFRVDSSSSIGSGHIIRCLTLAHALSRGGTEINFICRELPGHGIALIIANGFNVIPLPYSKHDAEATEHLSLYQRWLGTTQENELAAINTVLKGLNGSIDWLIVDHYALDWQWEKQFKSGAQRLMVIDDLANRQHDCDLLLDQNFYSNPSLRYAKLAPKNCIQLLGPHYALLRDEFVQERKNAKVRDKLDKVLIFFGAVDLTNETKKAILACLEISNIKHIKVIVGYANPYKEEIESLCNFYSRLSYYCNIQNMAELMVGVDLAIGAGGSTTWERCCMGLPTMVIPIAENQIESANTLNSAGIIKKIDDLKEQDLVTYLQFLIANLSALTAMSEKCFDIVDGKGAERVVAAMLTMNRR